MTKPIEIYTDADFVKIARKHTLMPTIAKYEKDILMGSQYVLMFGSIMLLLTVYFFESNPYLIGFAIGCQFSAFVVIIGYAIHETLLLIKMNKERKAYQTWFRNL